MVTFIACGAEKTIEKKSYCRDTRRSKYGVEMSNENSRGNTQKMVQDRSGVGLVRSRLI